jgi:hypothetical protein
MMDINPNGPDVQQSGERPLNLSDFAQRNQMTEDRVWELIEEGELAARFVNDEILILREQDTLTEPRIDLQEAPAIPIGEESDVLPSPLMTLTSPEPVMLEAEDVADDVMIAAPIESAPVSRPVEKPRPGATEQSGETKVAEELFADHDTSRDEDTMPGDDYRDLLVFAQDAMNRTMDLSRQLLGTKDELIRMKDERIQQLQAELQRDEQEIRRLRKKVEDLETLCRLTPNP